MCNNTLGVVMHKGPENLSLAQPRWRSCALVKDVIFWSLLKREI